MFVSCYFYLCVLCSPLSTLPFSTSMELVVGTALHLRLSSRPSLLVDSKIFAPTMSSSNLSSSSRHFFPRFSADSSRNPSRLAVFAGAVDVDKAERNRFPADVRVTETREPHSTVNPLLLLVSPFYFLFLIIRCQFRYSYCSFTFFFFEKNILLLLIFIQVVLFTGQIERGGSTSRMSGVLQKGFR